MTNLLKQVTPNNSPIAGDKKEASIKTYSSEYSFEGRKSMPSISLQMQSFVKNKFAKIKK
ncbi:hypothetical protein [Dinghuibacter silviterrae]|uniref:hypothetical protein n=1 Tax=Dinghuibacter silviterrae TaxID=1539049 RepID=UPI001062F551|nr:hypothetical protein [Dinghuibacter silviterrae]